MHCLVHVYISIYIYINNYKYTPLDCINVYEAIPLGKTSETSLILSTNSSCFNFPACHHCTTSKNENGIEAMGKDDTTSVDVDIDWQSPANLLM